VTMLCSVACSPCPPQGRARPVPVGDDRPMGAHPVVEQGPPRRGGPPAEAPCPRAPARRWAACPWLGMRLHPTPCGRAARPGNGRRMGSQPRVTWTAVEASHARRRGPTRPVGWEGLASWESRTVRTERKEGAPWLDTPPCWP